MGNLKDILHPDWDTLRDSWLNHIPSGSPSVSADELIRQSAAVPVDKQELDVIAGLRERTFADALFLRDKALYCYKSSVSLNGAGYPTWTLISMYDASFFAAKSFIYLLGFRDAGRSSKAYLTLFHSYKSNKVSFDGHYAVLLNERLTHDSLWSIFTRLISTLRGQSNTVKSVRLLRKNNYDQFSRERNWLVYEASSWSRADAISTSDLHSPQTYDGNIDFVSDSGETRAEFVDKYYRTAHTIINLIDDLLSDIGTFAPGIAAHLVSKPGLPAIATPLFA